MGPITIEFIDPRTCEVVATRDVIERETHWQYEPTPGTPEARRRGRLAELSERFNNTSKKHVDPKGDLAGLVFRGGLPEVRNPGPRDGFRHSHPILEASAPRLEQGQIVSIYGFGTSNRNGTGGMSACPTTTNQTYRQENRLFHIRSRAQDGEVWMGDSGGPIFVTQNGQTRLVGLTSFTDPAPRGVWDRITTSTECGNETVAVDLRVFRDQRSTYDIEGRNFYQRLDRKAALHAPYAQTQPSTPPTASGARGGADRTRPAAPGQGRR